MKTTFLKDPMTSSTPEIKINAKAPSFVSDEGSMQRHGYIPTRKVIAPERLKMALEEAKRLVSLGESKGLPSVSSHLCSSFGD